MLNQRILRYLAFPFVIGFITFKISQGFIKNPEIQEYTDIVFFLLGFISGYKKDTFGLMLAVCLVMFFSPKLEGWPKAIAHTIGLICIIRAYLLIFKDLYLRFTGIFSRFKKVKVEDSRSFYQSYQWRRLRLKVFEKYGNNCACFVPGCNNPATHVDHIKPRSKFPHLALDINNMQLLCPECNRAKSNDIIADFRQYAS